MWDLGTAICMQYIKIPNLKQRARPDEAIAQYLSAITLKSDYADARYNLDVAVRMLKDRGIVPGEKSRSFSALTHNNAGNFYLRQGNVDAALAEYRAALRLNPDFADAHYNLGWAYRSKGRDDDALREYQTAVRCRPDDAQREYEAALKLKPDFGDARYNLQIVAML